MRRKFFGAGKVGVFFTVKGRGYHLVLIRSTNLHKTIAEFDSCNGFADQGQQSIQQNLVWAISHSKPDDSRAVKALPHAKGKVPVFGNDG